MFKYLIFRMRKSEAGKSPGRLKGVRKSMSNIQRSRPSNVRNSLMRRNSFCPSTSKTGKRRQMNKDPSGLNNNKAWVWFELCIFFRDFSTTCFSEHNFDLKTSFLFNLSIFWTKNVANCFNFSLEVYNSMKSFSLDFA